MIQMKWLKLSLAGLLALSLAAGFIWSAAAEIGGADIHFSGSFGGASPEIVVSSNGQFAVVTYYKQDAQNNRGAVYVKSGTASNGWLASTFLGLGSNSRLAFRNGSNTIVYVVWASGDGKAIQTAACTVSAAAPPVCAPGANVQTTSVDALDFPDIAVDSSGFIHVVWENNGAIQSARSTSANSLAGWSAAATISGSGTDQKPVLAVSGSNLHLAFLRGATPTSVQYRSSGTGSHSWSGSTSFAIGGAIIGGSVHDRLDNPAIAASGNNVFLAWDAHRIGTNSFSLIQATSADNGSSWGSSPTYAPSGGATNLSSAGTESKPSNSSGVPIQETGLRPSLAISGTNAVIAWQQAPGTCGTTTFDPSTIFFASSLTGGTSETLTNYDNDYMADASLAVAAGGVRHFVFMKDNNADGDCAGGEASDYRITYRGPFTNTINDKGEGGTYLPVIRKNN